jgi:hypothetical protein
MAEHNQSPFQSETGIICSGISVGAAINDLKNVGEL